MTATSTDPQPVIDGRGTIHWIGVLPLELVKAHLNLDDATIARLPKTRPLITR